MAAVRFLCARCGEPGQQPAGSVNRARRIGAPLYCGRACAGLARRKNRSDAEKREAKRRYDTGYRRDNAAKLKAEKAAYHQRTYDPDAARETRKARMPRHVEYCRRPEYRVKKAAYDLKRRAQQDAGAFWESYVLLRGLERELLSRATRYEIDFTKGTTNKAQNRRRTYERTYGNRA